MRNVIYCNQKKKMYPIPIVVSQSTKIRKIRRRLVTKTLRKVLIGAYNSTSMEVKAGVY